MAIIGMNSLGISGGYPVVEKLVLGHVNIIEVVGLRLLQHEFL